jgi:hypothetical protein
LAAVMVTTSVVLPCCKTRKSRDTISSHRLEQF